MPIQRLAREHKTVWAEAAVGEEDAEGSGGDGGCEGQDGDGSEAQIDEKTGVGDYREGINRGSDSEDHQHQCQVAGSGKLGRRPVRR